MAMLDRLDRWKDQSTITAEQHTLFRNLVRDDPFSLFSELNILLYAGVLAFVIGLGWTVTTFSAKVGDVLVVSLLAAIIAASLYYCFKHAPVWSPNKTTARTFLADYVLYLCCLVWGIELAYLEQRLYLFPGHYDRYLLATAIFFFYLAYRFDNRLVLSLALSTLAGWFGFTVARLPFFVPETYRQYALSFCAVLAIGALILRSLKLKPHFFATYLNLLTNVLFIALLSGVFDSDHRGHWFLALLLTAAASLAWGTQQRQFAFVAYASVYTYIAAASLLLRSTSSDPTGTIMLLVIAAIAMLIMLVVVSRRFGRTQ